MEMVFNHITILMENHELSYYNDQRNYSKVRKCSKCIEFHGQDGMCLLNSNQQNGYFTDLTIKMVILIAYITYITYITSNHGGRTSNNVDIIGKKGTCNGNIIGIKPNPLAKLQRFYDFYGKAGQFPLGFQPKLEKTE